jgi:predicted protein tyrosine phosphatase
MSDNKVIQILLEYARKASDPTTVITNIISANSKEKLYLSGVVPITKKALDKLKIKNILNVGAPQPLSETDIKSYNYLLIKASDIPEEQLSDKFEQAFEFLQNCKGPTLVHCYAGRSRSVTVVLAYLIKYHNMLLSDALHHVASLRPGVFPNTGFINQLENFAAKEGANDLLW